MAFIHFLIPFMSHQFYFSPMKASNTQNSSALMLKQEFLKKWKKGLQIYTTTFNKETTISQRKNAIKFSSDIAIASARNTASTQWSRALMADLVSSKNVAKNKTNMITCSKKITRSRRCRRSSVVGSSVKASRVARELVKKRTRVLKRLVPGGERMDEISLIKETLDYIASLQVQVEVMRNFVAVVERSDRTSN